VALSNTTLGVLLETIDASITLIAMPDILRGIHLDLLGPGNSFYLLWMILGFLVAAAFVSKALVPRASPETPELDENQQSAGVKMTRRQRPVLAAIAGTLAIAACGSSSKSSQAAGVSQGIKFADCMRSHGVPNFPDPSGGGGIEFQGSSINPSSPAFEGAQHDCRTLLPGGGPGSGPPATAQQKATMLHLSQCMRAHGVSGFPDPTSSPPSSPAGFSLAFGRPGAFLAIPNTIDTQSPVFKQAGKACRFPGT
jgi:hypothetical protein